MNTQIEEVKQLCEYVGMLEQQICFMTEEIKSVRQELVTMREDTLSKHVKDALQKAVDILQKQCNSLGQQVKKIRENICESAGEIVDVVKQKGRMALYKVIEVTGTRKKLSAIKDKVDQAIDRMENLEQTVGKYSEQQRKISQRKSVTENFEIVNPQREEYGAEMFEKYQREHDVKHTVRTTVQAIKQERR